ncbi:hypothetical protein ACJA88_005269 [Fusarium oxysporum]
MEVFCRNVPQDLSEESFKQELMPFMKALNITDFYCEKPKRRPQAWIKFLNPGDGYSFLERHGKQQRHNESQKENINPRYPFKTNFRPKDTPRLHILKTAVFVEQTPVKAFSIIGISCGGNTFRGPQQVITFVEHNSLMLPRDIIGKFMPQWLTVYNKDGYRMDFHNDTIQDLIASRNDASITLVLTEPPKMYTPHKSDNPNQEWKRVQGLVNWGLIREYSASCLVYRIFFASINDMNEVLRSVKHRDILAITYHDLPSVLWSYMEPESNHFLGRQQFTEKAKRILALGNVHFALLFQVQALVWNNYINPASGIELLQILEEVIKDAKENQVAAPVTTDAMKGLHQKIPYPCPGTDPDELNVITLMTSIMNEEYEARAENPKRDRIYGVKIPDHQIYIFKAMVTPTRVLLSGPEPDSKNRVLRKYHENNDYFLRVLFCEEDGQDLNFHPKVDNEPIFARFRHVMDEGITIAGRKFDFLGFSHSSLRSHSAWFSAPFTDSNFERQTPAAILQALGDFSEIRVPAKCAARIGQAFSETPYAIPIFETGICHRFIPDVKSEDGTRVFSDGVGTISREALEEIWPYLSMRAAVPTCLQIRWGGCKGMLSLDTRLKGRVFCIRQESMMKFPSDDLRELGICDASSKPLRLVLNRQMIKILEDMGTTNDWFFRLQNNALDILRNATADATNTSYFLDYQAIGVNMGLPKLVKQLEKMGIDYRRDKFLKGRRINSMLKDGQIIVTRSPALHPGDIQIVNQVTPPQGHPLRSLQNCIVFSQKGKRDLPSMLSGGDLDGDLYNIIWDPDALPDNYFLPADYPRVKPKPLDRPVKPQDIADFFVDFMRTDILGMIATRHVVLADYHEQGTTHPDCISLAGMHSTAVDFSKTGIPVDVKALPKNPPFRPDLSDEAWKIRGLYESTITGKMWDFSENPRAPLTEVEVFCGFILNKRGAQTRRQGDSSIKLKEEIDRIMTWMVKQIRDRGVGDGAETLSAATDADAAPSRWREDVVELCWACVAVACIRKEFAPIVYHGTGELESFRVVAACCLLKELNNLARKMEVSAGGGFVGVGRGRGGRGRGGVSMILPIR